MSKGQKKQPQNLQVLWSQEGPDAAGEYMAVLEIEATGHWPTGKPQRGDGRVLDSKRTPLGQVGIDLFNGKARYGITGLKPGHYAFQFVAGGKGVTVPINIESVTPESALLKEKKEKVELDELAARSAEAEFKAAKAIHDTNGLSKKRRTPAEVERDNAQIHADTAEAKKRAASAEAEIEKLHPHSAPHTLTVRVTGWKGKYQFLIGVGDEHGHPIADFEGRVVDGGEVKSFKTGADGIAVYPENAKTYFSEQTRFFEVHAGPQKELKWSSVLPGPNP